MTHVHFLYILKIFASIPDNHWSSRVLCKLNWILSRCNAVLQSSILFNWKIIIWLPILSIKLWIATNIHYLFYVNIGDAIHFLLNDDGIREVQSSEVSKSVCPAYEKNPELCMSAFQENWPLIGKYLMLCGGSNSKYSACGHCVHTFYCIFNVLSKNINCHTIFL